MKSLPAILVFLLSFSCTENIQGQSKNVIQNTLNALDTFIERKIKEAGIVGIGAAIIIDKKIVWSKGYGYADKEKGVAFTPHTIMNIASITKTFTGVCMMKAVEEKKLSLDDDINKYLPFKVVNPYFPNEIITLRNLATHTSSLADRYPFYEDHYYYKGDTPEQLGDFLKDYFVPGGKYYTKENFLDKKPGQHRDYSNIAAGLAGYIVEIVTGKKLNEYSREHIFKPLKMKNSGWFLSEINLANHSKLYDKKGDTLKVIPFYSVPTYPDGGIRSSVAELSKFFIALLDDGNYKGTRILKKETVQEIKRYQFTEANKPGNVDLAKLNSGIFWATKNNATRIGHAGSDPGVKTEMLCNLSQEVGVILFMNTDLTEKNLAKYHFGIFNELMKRGEEIKAAKK